MCIYDDTRYICGATIRHIVVPCSDQGTCVEHIRWTDHRAEECDNCRNTGQEATGPVFGIESLLTTSTSSCAGSGYLWNYFRTGVPQCQTTPERSEHGIESPIAAQEYGEGQYPVGQDHISSVSTTSTSSKATEEEAPLPEHLERPATQPGMTLTEDADGGGVKLDNEDRRILAEVDRTSENNDSVEGEPHQAGDSNDANVGLLPWFYG